MNRPAATSLQVAHRASIGANWLAPKRRLERRDQGQPNYWVLVVALLVLLADLLLVIDQRLPITAWHLVFLPPALVAAERLGWRAAAIVVGSCLMNALVVYLIRESALAWPAAPAFAASSSDDARTALAATGDAGVALSRPWLLILGGAALTVAAALTTGVMRDRDRLESLHKGSPIRAGLGRYLAPEIVAETMLGHDELSLATARKRISVLCADLRGFTALSERLEPEELSAQLNEYLSELTAIALKHGGTLDQYVGDAIKVIFGDPTYYEDHAERAVRAALEMRDRWAELRAHWVRDGRTELHMGIGVHTGPVTVGHIGSTVRRQYSAIGLHVDLAYHLADLAEPEQILVSAETLDVVRSTVQARPTETLAMPAGIGAIDIWEVSGERALQHAVTKEPDWSYILRRVVLDETLRSQILTNPELYLSGELVTDSDREYLLGLATALEHPVFAGIDPQELMTLLVLAARRRFPADTAIVQPGGRAADWHLLVHGSAVVLHHDREGREVHVSTLEAGAQFGGVLLADTSGEEMTVRAHTQATLLVLPAGALAAVAQAAPHLFARLDARGAGRAPERQVADQPRRRPAS